MIQKTFLNDLELSYPRLCAHRGFNAIAPENSMPAFGAAYALGADEIEFDIWETIDGVLVSCHDASLERVSNGKGFIYEKSYDELRTLDFGANFHHDFAGLRIVRFEEILEKFARRIIMNIHVKTKTDLSEYNPASLDKIISTIDRYDCRDFVYLMCGNDHFHAIAQKRHPEITRCCGAGNTPWEIVERGIRYGCKKIQLFKPFFNQQMIDKAHANGMLCNIFYADDKEEARRYLKMGIDTVLTNNYLVVAQALNKYR